MAKQKKVAYGIAEDGLSLKLAYLSRDGNQIALEALEQIELQESLYQHPARKSESSENKPEAWAPEEDTSGPLSLEDITAEDKDSYGTQPYEALFQTYSLNQGVIAINAYDEQIIKLPLGSPGITSQQKQKLVKENLSRSEFKEGHWQASVVTINEQSELWIHRGTNRLLEILEQTRKAQRNTFYYQLADANETALANLFLTTQAKESSENSMVLYLGSDYNRALLFEGNKWTFSLPIYLPPHQHDIEVVYSKLSLALDEAHIVDPENVYVCGDNCFIDAVEYLRSQLPNSNVEMWHLGELYMDSEALNVYDMDMIARFMLPVALAWKALTMENSETLKTNFLPSYIVEGQKVFKIAWHGYLLFALVFLGALFFTFSIQQLKFSITQENALNKQLQIEHAEKKEQADAMMAMEKAIQQQNVIIETIKTLLKGKNQWTEIITNLNDSFQTHPTSWIRNLRKDGDGFKVLGVTTHRPNIVYFAGLFPNGSIINAKYRKIRDFTVWDFEINYSYPEVDWYKMMEEDAQELRRYQEAKGIETAKPAGTGEAARGSLTQRVSQAVSGKLDDKVVVNKSIIDLPHPPEQMLIAEANDPAVIAYKEIVTAFNSKNDWQMSDLGVKFINAYPKSPLIPYIRWYIAYRFWQNRQNDQANLWLGPIRNSRNAVYPFTLLLSSEISRAYGNKKLAEDYLRKVIADYPQHQTAITAKKLLGE